MNKEISLKKFLLFLSLFLLIMSVVLILVVKKTKPLCKNNPCKNAVCTTCSEENQKRVCSDCNLYDEENRRIWTGNCIYNS